GRPDLVRTRRSHVVRALLRRGHAGSGRVRFDFHRHRRDRRLGAGQGNSTDHRKARGDGSYFEPTMIHYAWNAWDLTWWYAAPVSGLGFHDNSVDFRIDPGPGVDAPPVIAWSPDLGMITFENRARTVASESTSTIGDNFFR